MAIGCQKEFHFAVSFAFVLNDIYGIARNATIDNSWTKYNHKHVCSTQILCRQTSNIYLIWKGGGENEKKALHDLSLNTIIHRKVKIC